MLKTNNKQLNSGKNLVFYSLGILALLAFGAIVAPAKASAQAGYNYTFNTSNGNPYNYNNYSYNQNSYQAPVYVQAQPSTPVTPILYSNSANSSTVNNTTTSKTIAKAKTTSVSKTSVASTTNSNSNSSLAANALLGSTDSFTPSGLIQWILFAILILIIVILVRKVFGGRDNYNKAPMKHE